MIRMFAIKCQEGYLRIINEQEITCVSLAKATVFQEVPFSVAKVIDNAEKAGLTQLRVVELHISEKDPEES